MSELVGHYQYKPRQITAVRITHDNVEMVCEWAGGQSYIRRSPHFTLIIRFEGFVSTTFLHGVFGDWLWKDEAGELYHSRNEEFQSMFEPVGIHDDLILGPLQDHDFASQWPPYDN